MSDLHPWEQPDHDRTLDVDDIAHPGLDLGAELGYQYPPDEHGLGVGIDMSMEMGLGGMPLGLDSMAGLGDSLGAELGGDSLQAQLRGDSLGAELGLDSELGGTLGDELQSGGAGNAATGDDADVAAGTRTEAHTTLPTTPNHTSPVSELVHASPSPPVPIDVDAPHLDDAQARFEARLQAAHARTLAQLRDTITHTDTFLAKLRPRPVGKASVEEDIQRLEATAAAVVRQLQDTAIQREAQVRELKEAQLVLDVLEPPTHKQLSQAQAQAQIQPRSTTGASADASADLPAASGPTVSSTGPHWVPRKAVAPELDADDQIIEASLSGPLGSDEEDILGLLAPAADRRDDMTTPAATPVTKRAVLRGGVAETSDERAQAPRPGQVGAGMVAVRATTSDLLTGLAAINEHTQVYRAAVNDLSRKFRGLRGALTQIVAETNSTQHSIEWLTRWRARQATDFCGAVAAGARALDESDPRAGLLAWIAEVRGGMDQALIDATGKAHAMLQPPPPPACVAEVDLSKVSLPLARAAPASVTGQA